MKVGRLSATKVSTHSRPKAAACLDLTIHPHLLKFQHTAARRRLHLDLHLIEPDKHVSTHSRPKAAA